MSKKRDRELTIADKILLGALKYSEGDIHKPFTFEELVLATWELDKNTFGLRGFENNHPDSHKLHPNVFGATAIISRGYIRAERDCFLYITEAGIARALAIQNIDAGTEPRLAKHLQKKVLQIIHHSVFQKWLADRTYPHEFRDIGYFWEISPGTPPSAVRKRLDSIENTLEEILNYFDQVGLENLSEDRVGGKILFERKDVERCLEFHTEMKSRFKKELKILDPEGKY